MAFNIPKAITPKEVADQLKQGNSLKLLDVRDNGEWAAGHIQGVKHIPLGQLLERLHELEPEQETIVICQSGNRSGLTCELLNERGYRVVNMTGGLNAWADKLIV